MTQLLNALPGALAQGLIWGVMAIGVYITYKVLDIADLTVDGSICTGAAVCTMLLLGGQSPWLALDHLSLTLRDGDFVTVIGGNGAGKSTMQNAICGTWQPDEGSIELDGVNVSSLPEYKRARYLGLGLEDRLTTKVGTLSGGQRQALTLLMATLVTPKLLLLDEHTAALDPATAEKVLALTKKIVAENHITCLMITHNIPSALSLGNRTIMMNNGRIALELAGAERENMTTEQLLKVFHEQGVSNDRILFSAES